MLCQLGSLGLEQLELNSSQPCPNFPQLQVWLADYKGTPFAVKELFSGRGEQGSQALTPAELRDFQREAELCADLHHPHVLAFMGEAGAGLAGSAALAGGVAEAAAGVPF